jgi:FkbM family methyltransferase
MIRKRRVAAEIERYTPRRATHVYAGFPLTLEFQDPLAAGWYDRDWSELPELALLRSYGLRAGARVFDLGAHQCLVALILARIVGDGGEVIAVEAEPHNARMAEVNRRLNGADNLTVVHAAVADAPGTITFAEGLNGSIDESTCWGNVTVPAVTVDQLADRHGHPDVVFVDVEGFEARVLDGAFRTLRSRRTSFFVEVHVEKLVDGTAESVLACFEGFERFIALDRGHESSHRFAPYEQGDAIPDERFFLVAAPFSG